MFSANQNGKVHGHNFHLYATAIHRVRKKNFCLEQQLQQNHRDEIVPWTSTFLVAWKHCKSQSFIT